MHQSIIISCALSAVIVVNTAEAVPQYTIEIIDPTSERLPYDVTDTGAVLYGSFTTAHRTFTWDAGVVTPVRNINWIGETGLAMNDAGVVVGYAWMNTTVGNQAFTYDTTTQTFGTIPFGGTRSEAAEINNLGQVVGFGQDSTGKRRAKLLDNGTVVDLGLLPNMVESNAYDINELGQVVGKTWPGNFQQTRPFIWENGVMTELPASGWGSAQEINDNGDILGFVDSHPVVWINGVENTLTGTVPYSKAFDINNQGLVVGYSYEYGASWYEYRATVWDNLLPYDLNDLVINIDPTYSLFEAITINELGQIAGYGRFEGDVKSVYLLTPVPEPTTAGVLLCAILAMVGRTRPAVPGEGRLGNIGFNLVVL